MSTRKGEVSRAERIRELAAKGMPIELISLRVGIKQSVVRRAIERGADRGG